MPLRTVFANPVTFDIYGNMVSCSYIFLSEDSQVNFEDTDRTKKIIFSLNAGYGTARFKLDTRECSTRVFCDSFRVFCEISRVYITIPREIAVHNTLRATCKSHHTSMQNTCVISKTMARRKSNLKMGRIFMQTHLPLCSD